MDQKLVEIDQNGYCVLKARLPKGVIEACRNAFWPILLKYIESHGDKPNRGPHRHFLPGLSTGLVSPLSCFLMWLSSTRSAA
jgi:hypothetical protein